MIFWSLVHGWLASNPIICIYIYIYSIPTTLLDCHPILSLGTEHATTSVFFSRVDLAASYPESMLTCGFPMTVCTKGTILWAKTYIRNRCSSAWVWPPRNVVRKPAERRTAFRHSCRLWHRSVLHLSRRAPALVRTTRALSPVHRRSCAQSVHCLPHITWR